MKIAYTKFKASDYRKWHHKRLLRISKAKLLRAKGFKTFILQLIGRENILICDITGL